MDLLHRQSTGRERPPPANLNPNRLHDSSIFILVHSCVNTLKLFGPKREPETGKTAETFTWKEASAKASVASRRLQTAFRSVAGQLDGATRDATNAHSGTLSPRPRVPCEMLSLVVCMARACLVREGEGRRQACNGAGIRPALDWFSGRSAPLVSEEMCKMHNSYNFLWVRMRNIM